MYDGFTIIIIILVILIIGVVLDGIRRVRSSRRDGIRISKNAQKADELDLGREPTANEFPSGGARVVSYRDAESTEGSLPRVKPQRSKEQRSKEPSLQESINESREATNTNNRLLEQVALKLNESVPMLMESVEEQNRLNDGGHHSQEHVFTVDEHSHKKMNEPSSTDAPETNSLDDVDDYFAESSEVVYTYVGDEPEPNTQDDAFNHNANAHTQQVHSSELAHHHDPVLGSLNHLDDDYSSSDKRHSLMSDDKSLHDAPLKSTHKQKNKQKTTTSDEPQWQEPDEVIVFNLMAKTGFEFEGRALLAALMQEGLKLGEMDIFHRYHDNDGDAPILFSLANMVVPGTFNLSQMDGFSTPGVSMFLSLPIQGDSISAYENLVKTATNLAMYLDGDLKDESRSVLTKQNIEHARQRVVEYERKRKLAPAPA